MDNIKIIHHGAINGVTGSCHELRVNKDAGILIDCGLFQGADVARNASHSQLEIDFPIKHIKALVVTHVHIDHVGRIPYLLAAGFNAPIYCSEPSAILLPLVLEDALKIGAIGSRHLQKQKLDKIRKLITPVPYKQWTDLNLGQDNSLAIRLQPAGHILGSAYVECRSGIGKNSQITIFSGDLGAPYAPLLVAPKSPWRADTVVLESTYGDRNHEGRKARREVLRHVVEKALRNRGSVLIPSFSIGRTQELLYELESIIHQYGNLPATRDLPWKELDIVIDSPLAAKFTQVYRQLKPYWDKEARQRLSSGRHPLSFAQLTTIPDHKTHLQAVKHLSQSNRPAIVIAASGMCTGGRIVNYLKAMIDDPRHDVLFVGYQASGSAGRDIQQYGPKGGYVILGGEKFAIKAGVYTISGYSAHAGQRDLLNFIQRMQHQPKEIRLVHGDKTAKEILKKKLLALGGNFNVIISQ